MINGINNSTINGVVASSVCGIAQSSQAILFTHTGDSFTPRISLKDTATVLWSFPDGTSSSELIPTATFTGAEERVTELTVTPWSALEMINIGYGHDDGGSTSIPDHAVQAVTAVNNLGLVADTLEIFCGSRTPMVELNFDNFLMLHTIEMFYSQAGTPDFSSLSISNTPALQRVCYESSSVTGNAQGYIDFSTTPLLSDVRGAFCNTYNGFIFGATGDNLFHLCCQYNSTFDVQIPATQFPIIREIYWNAINQTGHLEFHPNVDNISYFYGRENAWTSADFSGTFLYGSGRNLEIYNNSLTSLDITGCIGVGNLLAQNNNLPVSEVNAILIEIESWGTSNGYIRLDLQTPSAIPTATAAITALEGRGWTVNVDS